MGLIPIIVPCACINVYEHHKFGIRYETHKNPNGRRCLAEMGQNFQKNKRKSSKKKVHD